MKVLYSASMALVGLLLNVTKSSAETLFDGQYPSDGNCGGVVEGNNRTLVYDQTFDYPVQCVWTIQPVGRFPIMTFRLIEGSLTQDDFLAITVFTQNYNLAASSVTPYTRVINTTVPYEYDTTIAFAVLIFRTNSTENRYFHLDIQARPSDTSDSYEPNLPYFNWHSSEEAGEVRYPKGNPDTPTYTPDELATFLISNPRHGNGSADNILLEIPETDITYSHGGFIFHGKACQGDGVVVFEILPELGYYRPCSFMCDPWKDEVYIFKELDEGVCGVGGGYGYYANRGYLITFASSGNEVATGFTFNWKNVDRLAPTTPEPVVTPVPGAYTSCGGILEGESSYIEYKLNDEYSPNEFCVWTFRYASYRRIVFTKEASGLVVGEDLITVTTYRIPWDGNAAEVRTEELQLNAKYGGEEQFNMYGTLAVIVFTSNGANQGRGFRLKVQAFQDGIGDTERFFTDLGQYGDTGAVGHGYGKEFFFSSFVVAPNTTQEFKEVSLHLVEMDLWAGDGCSLNAFYLHEILPSSAQTTLSGTIVQTETLCHTLENQYYTAERGFLGLLVTSRTPYTEPINGYNFTYTIMQDAP